LKVVHDDVWWTKCSVKIHETLVMHHFFPLRAPAAKLGAWWVLQVCRELRILWFFSLDSSGSVKTFMPVLVHSWICGLLGRWSVLNVYWLWNLLSPPRWSQKMRVLRTTVKAKRSECRRSDTSVSVRTWIPWAIDLFFSEWTRRDYCMARAGRTIDYRCDEEKKNSWVGETSWYHCVAEDSRIPKMPVINPLQALVHPQTKKKKKNYPARIVNPQPQLIRILFFW
jgi:hypothetical protein